MRQITKDHSLVQDLVDEGRISDDEAWDHPKKNIINRVLGDNSGFQVDTGSEKIYGDDIILLCCDGLSDMLPDVKICDLVISQGNINKGVTELIQEANNAGGKDNISVILVKPSPKLIFIEDLHMVTKFKGRGKR